MEHPVQQSSMMKGRRVRYPPLLAFTMLLSAGAILLFCGSARAQDWRLSAGYSLNAYSLDYTANGAYSGSIPFTRKGALEFELERYLLYRFYVAGKADFLLQEQHALLGGGPLDFGRANLGAVMGLQWEQWGVYGGVKAGRIWDLKFLAEDPEGRASWIPAENPDNRWTTAFTGGVKYYLLNFIRLEAGITAYNSLPEPAVPSAGTGRTPALNAVEFNPYTVTFGVTFSIPWNSKKRLERINDRGNLPSMIKTDAVRFRSPMKRSTQVTSAFGPRGRGGRHDGVDLDADRGDDILAAESGIVIEAGKGTGYGRMVKIRHGAGFVTLYAHLSRIKVREGERVKRGQLIGKAGNTGQSRGIHLHFEIIENNRHLNPQRYIRF